MTMREGLISLLVVCLVSGCRPPNPTVDLLESELRWLEDQLYLAEEEYQTQAAQLASCRVENRTLRKGTASKTPDSRVLEGPSPGGPAPPAEPDELPDVVPPEVEEGEAMEPQIEFPQPPTLPMDINLRPASTNGSVSEPVDAHVTHIVFNSRLTGGYDFDGQPGDEGLLIVVEPRNADGQYVQLPGPVSVVVLDPAQQGPAARVARWDFDSVETARLIRKTLFGRGIHLELPWPNDPPQAEHLRIYVRFVTVDGRKLDADRAIDVQPPGRGWTPAASVVPTSTEEPNGKHVSQPNAHEGNFGAQQRSPGEAQGAPDGKSIVVSGTDASGTDSSGDSVSGVSSRGRAAHREGATQRSRRPHWQPYR